MKKILAIFVFAGIFAFSGISYAIDGPDWEKNQESYMQQNLTLDANFNINVLGFFSIPLIMHTESVDNGVYTTTAVDTTCSVSNFEKCNFVNTGDYNDITVDSGSSYADMRGNYALPPYSEPNDITPLRIKEGSTPTMSQTWEVYDAPGESKDLATSRRIYHMDYQIEFQCTPSQGVWDLSLIDSSIKCSQQEADNYVWKQMGTQGMVADVELNLTDRYKPLPLDFPISDTKTTFTQTDTPMQVIASISLPIALMAGDPIEVDEVRTYDLSFEYDDGDITVPEPDHGDCVNDDQVYMYGTATNVDPPYDVINFTQWYSEGLQYLSNQTITGINVDVYDDSNPSVVISGNIAFDDMGLSVTNRTDSIYFTNNPDPLVRGQLGNFYESYFIMGPGHGPNPVAFGFQVINPPFGIFTSSGNNVCGRYDDQLVKTLPIPQATPDHPIVGYGLQFLGVMDIGGTKSLNVVNP